jgi:maleylacetate reductase
LEFTYAELPSKVVFGPGAARTRHAEQLEELGLTKVMLLASRSKLDLARDLTAPVAHRIGSTFSGVLPHVPAHVAQAALAQAIDTGADGLLSVGGGSTTGTAKIVALTTRLPVIAIPTTYAGSEMTPVWGLTTDSRKETGADRVVLPRTVLYDSDLTRALPLELAISSGFNALAHCIEAFWGPGANPVTNLKAAEGVRTLAAGMRKLKAGSATADDYDHMLYGAHLAGGCFAVAGSGLHHKICHALGGAFNLPHASLHAVVLPHVLAFNVGSISADARLIASALGAPEASKGLAELASELGAPRTLKELGLTASQLEEAIEIVSAKLPMANPRPVSRNEISEILSAAFSESPEFSALY